MSKIRIFKGDCLGVLPNIVEGKYDLVYADVPFNTGQVRRRKEINFSDKFDDYEKFIVDRVAVLKSLLSDRGSLFLHCDHHEGHYIKTWLDRLFSRECFMGELIWHWDYGAKPHNKWAQKHNYIFWYANDPKSYIFNYEDIDRVPYMSNAFIDQEKFERGKVPTNVWFMTIVPTMSEENTGYPTQKPQKLLDRIVRVHTLPDSRVLDPFAGSGTTGASCLKYGRDCDLIDESKDAIKVMEKRFPGSCKVYRYAVECNSITPF